MRRQDRERARRVAEYVDGLLLYRRSRERARDAAQFDDKEYTELARLATLLNCIHLVPPDAFASSLARRLEEGRRGIGDIGDGCSPSWTGLGTRLRTTVGWVAGFPHTLRTAAAMAMVLAVGAASLFHVTSVRTVSASTVLSRADSALVQLVQPGRVLYRRWNVVTRTRDASGGPDVVETRSMLEWMDGSNPEQVAGRSVSASGETLLAYTRVPEDGEYRGIVYFAPGFSNEPRGLLSIEPSRREFQQAVSGFSEGRRAWLQAYLERGYIYEPIVGERRFNRSVLDAGADHTLPRIVLSLDPLAFVGAVPVYRVRLVDPLRVRFRWRSAGPPVVWLTRLESVRSISRENYLSLKSEETYDFADGRHVVTSRELAETRIMDAAEIGGEADPFLLVAPAGVPVRRQSAVEQLTAVAAALDHAARLTSLAGSIRDRR